MLSAIKRLVLGRWFAAWLLRGGPWAVAAKLAGVAAWGAWKWRRERKRVTREQEQREIEADYVVLERPDERRSLNSITEQEKP